MALDQKYLDRPLMSRCQHEGFRRVTEEERVGAVDPDGVLVIEYCTEPGRYYLKEELASYPMFYCDTHAEEALERRETWKIRREVYELGKEVDRSSRGS